MDDEYEEALALAQFQFHAAISQFCEAFGRLSADLEPEPSEATPEDLALLRSLRIAP